MDQILQWQKTRKLYIEMTQTVLKVQMEAFASVIKRKVSFSPNVPAQYARCTSARRSITVLSSAIETYLLSIQSIVYDSSAVFLTLCF